MTEVITVAEQQLVVVDGDSPSIIQTTAETRIEVANTGSGDKHYEATFSSSAFVTITHNLGKRPAVTVLDTAEDEVVGDIRHLSANQLTISFTAPFSGVVLCN